MKVFANNDSHVNMYSSVKHKVGRFLHWPSADDNHSRIAHCFFARSFVLRRVFTFKINFCKMQRILCLFLFIITVSILHYSRSEDEIYVCRVIGNLVKLEDNCTQVVAKALFKNDINESG